MNIDKALILKWVNFAQGEVLSMRNCFRERGGKFFSRPLGVGILIVFVSYWYVFSPTADKIRIAEINLKAAEVTKQYAEDYENLQIRLETLKSKLPRVKEPDAWLLDEVRRTLREEGIVPLSTSSPTEMAGPAYRMLAITVRCQATYGQIASWISRLERSDSFLLVSEMKIKKDEEPVGSNTADVKIVTLVPKGGG